MERCRKCGKDYNLEDLPPSLRRTLKRCKECYTTKKKQVDKEWRNENRDKVKRHNKRRELALKEDYGEKHYIKIKTLKWKIRSLYYRIKKSKKIDTEVKLRRTLKEMRINLALLCKGKDLK